MIRFSCGTCGKPLRAPAILAGKKGRCAQCGGVNAVPALPIRSEVAVAAAAQRPAQNVEVKRAAGVSPFRSTADVTLSREVVAVQAGSQTVVPTRTADFFDHVAARMAPLDEPFDAHVDVPPRTRQPRMPEVSARPLHLNPPAAHNHPTAMVVVAMGIGLVVGICIGLMMAKWVL